MDKIKPSKIGSNYIIALKRKYESEMSEALANLELYSTNLVGIGEHSDLMTEHDKWIEIYTNAKDKLESIEKIFDQNTITKG